MAAVEDRADNLRRAVDAYTEALRFYTADAAPLDYAMTQYNLGVTLLDSGDLVGAIACWRAAERYYRQMNAIDDADRVLRMIVKWDRSFGDADGA